ncbi:MAG: M20/M25/M40 family metallo-hydrolase [Acidobacteria bacterium]|nr:M20/M25/M40 family metallo-hydrolase [Acidobacteriota bacterium]
MKKQFLSFLLLLSFVLSAAAQKTEVVVEQNLRTNVGYLASDQLEGRRTGEAGATAAAGYVANLFQQYKLKPGVATPVGNKMTRNYLQNFAYTTGVEIAPTGNEFKLSLKNAGGQATVDSGAQVTPLLASPNAEVGNAPVVFAGYGIESAESNFNDYEGLNVAGAVVLAFDGNPENDVPRSAFSRFTVFAKAKLAKDKGALGLLLISREDKLDNDRNANAKYDQTNGETAVPVFAVSRATGANILGLKVAELKTIESLVAMKKDTTAKVQVGFRDVSPTIGFKVNLLKKQTDAYNVIGILEGSDPVLKDEAIVIGAHYDHLGRGGQGSLAVNSTEVHHGADDNASGTAALLEMARIFAKEKKNKRTIIFISFGGEEEGLLGSKYYVNNPVFPLDKTVAMLNMDMVGRLNEDKLTVGGIGTAAEWKDLVTKKNEVIPPVYGDSKKNDFTPPSKETVYRFNLQLSEDGFGPSDHSSFYGKQIPVLFFFTGTHNDYHKPSDTADKINYAGIVKVVDYVADIARYVDGYMPKRPTYTVAKSSGQGEGRRSFSVTIGVIPGYGDATDGMLLDGVRDGGPAALAGLKAGDKIVKFNGKEVRNVQDYMFVLGDLKPDTEYEIEVLRGAERLTFKVKPTARKQ